MKWMKNDIKSYLQAKEYIDTIIVPLIPFHLTQDSDVEKSTFKSEVITVLVNEIEKELSGRVLLTPSYYYIKHADKDSETRRINSWVEDMEQQPFHHFFFLSFDSTWKKHEKDLKGNLIWLPGVQSGDIHSKEMQGMIRDQVEEICELIRSYW